MMSTAVVILALLLLLLSLIIPTEDGRPGVLAPIAVVTGIVGALGYERTTWRAERRRRSSRGHEE